jgi:hypothetical protein
VLKTTIIDFLAQRLPDAAESYPDWTIRCTWGGVEGGREVGCTFHAGSSERVAFGLAVFILDRYADLDAQRLSRADVLLPDGTWERVERPERALTAPVMFAFQQLPDRPGRRRPGSHRS